MLIRVRNEHVPQASEQSLTRLQLCPPAAPADCPHQRNLRGRQRGVQGAEGAWVAYKWAVEFPQRWEEGKTKPNWRLGREKTGANSSYPSSRSGFDNPQSGKDWAREVYLAPLCLSQSYPNSSPRTLCNSEVEKLDLHSQGSNPGSAAYYLCSLG